MSAAWITIAALTVGTFAAKVAGPLVLGAHRPSRRVMDVTGLLASAILAALVVFETLGGTRGGISLDARAAGLAAAVLALAARAPMIVVILLAAAVTALVRAAA
jgi:branched-subunit amino acid transport protein AzlD